MKSEESGSSSSPVHCSSTTETSRWPQDFPFRQISDTLYGTIKLCYPLDLIVDTPEFQRLRRIKQTGIVFLVYPCAEHSRFTHCLGVYHLAWQFIRALAKRPELNITSRDKLCVSIAGLCHDLGHGPFSHIFDTTIVRQLYPTSSWTHEECSVKILRRILNYPKVKDVLDQLLLPEDYIFIEELINPPKARFDKNGKWLYKGRDLEKSYLYDLICNTSNSLDVDKYDYLLRDSHYTSVSICFNLATVDRIRTWMMPLEVIEQSTLSGNSCKVMQLCYSYKVLNDLYSVGESRYELHRRVYNHHAVRSCEDLLVRALRAGAPYLRFTGDDGQEYTLANVVDNVEAFLKCDDYVLQRILYSTAPELKEARFFVDALLRRHLPKFVAGMDVLHGDFINEEIVKDAIIECMEQGSVTRDKFIVCIRRPHCGMGLEKSPMSAVRLYNHKDVGRLQAYSLEKDWLEKNPRFTGGNVSINIYVPYVIHKQDPTIATKVYEAFGRVCNNKFKTHDFECLYFFPETFWFNKYAELSEVKR